MSFMLGLFHLHHKKIQLQCPEGHSREMMNWHGVAGIEIITTVTKDFYEDSYKSLLKVILKRLKRGAMYAYQWKDSV